MKLYWGPHTCAIGIHVLLEEIGVPYETEKLDVGAGATHASEFLAINPKGKVPTLMRDDGSVLTEFGAIATWLALTHPEKGLLPTDPERQARAVEVLDYVEGTIHGQGYGRMFMPAKFGPQDVAHDLLGFGQAAVRKQGREMVEAGFAILAPVLGQYPYAVGDALTVADAALFYAERWAPQQEIVLPANVQAHFERMRARPAVRKVMEAWGEA